MFDEKCQRNHLPKFNILWLLFPQYQPLGHSALSSQSQNLDQSYSIKHDLAISCFQLWPVIVDEGDKILRKIAGEAIAETVNFVTLIVETYRKLRVLISKVGGKLWHQEGYIASKSWSNFIWAYQNTLDNQGSNKKTFCIQPSCVEIYSV